MESDSKSNDYWRKNLQIIGISLAVWFIASFLMGIILRPMLSGIMVGGADLGLLDGSEWLDIRVHRSDLCVRQGHEQVGP